MSQAVPNVPYNAPIADDSGRLSAAWSAFFRNLYIRIGSANALSNTELANQSSGAAFRAELTALEATVAANKAAADSRFNDLAQGRQL